MRVWQLFTARIAPWYHALLGLVHTTCCTRSYDYKKCPTCKFSLKPFKATFEDFVNGLYFYSEMTFVHRQVSYEVFFKNRRIVFCCEAFQREYNTREEFMEKANIDGRLLKDIWNEVEKPSYMSCCG